MRQMKTSPSRVSANSSIQRARARSAGLVGSRARGGIALLQVLADHRAVGYGDLVVDVDRNAPQRIELAEPVVAEERHDRVELIGHALHLADGEHLAHVRRHRAADDGGWARQRAHGERLHRGWSRAQYSPALRLTYDAIARRFRALRDRRGATRPRIEASHGLFRRQHQPHPAVPDHRHVDQGARAEGQGPRHHRSVGGRARLRRRPTTSRTPRSRRCARARPSTPTSTASPS